MVSSVYSSYLNSQEVALFNESPVSSKSVEIGKGGKTGTGPANDKSPASGSQEDARPQEGVRPQDAVRPQEKARQQELMRRMKIKNTHAPRKKSLDLQQMPGMLGVFHQNKQLLRQTILDTQLMQFIEGKSSEEAHAELASRVVETMKPHLEQSEIDPEQLSTLLGMIETYVTEAYPHPSTLLWKGGEKGAVLDGSKDETDLGGKYVRAEQKDFGFAYIPSNSTEEEKNLLETKHPGLRNRKLPILGAGTYGEVRIAEQIKSEEGDKDQLIAVKISRVEGEGIDSERRTKNFHNLLKEKDIFLKLPHNKYFSEVRATATIDGQVYLFQDLLSMGDLYDITKHIKNLPSEYQEPYRNMLARKMVETVKDMHEAGIFHLDLKPRNFMPHVMETEKGLEVVMRPVDFGFTEIAPAAEGRQVPADKPGGTPGYKQPKEGGGNALTADLFALGYSLLAVLDPSRISKNFRGIDGKMANYVVSTSGSKLYEVSAKLTLQNAELRPSIDQVLAMPCFSGDKPLAEEKFLDLTLTIMKEIEEEKNKKRASLNLPTSALLTSTIRS